MAHSLIQVTPTITAGAYTANKQVGGIMVLTGVSEGGFGGCYLRQLTITDKAKQSAAITVLFFDQLPVVSSSDNVACNVSAAELAAKGVGTISMPTANYAVMSATSLGSQAGLNGVFLRPSPLGTANTIYAVAFTTGTPTYASTSDLTFKFHFTWDYA